MATILTKRSNTASSVPVSGDLTNSADGAELAVNTADKRLFAKNASVIATRNEAMITAIATMFLISIRFFMVAG